jgi:hypothetical protein
MRFSILVLAMVFLVSCARPIRDSLPVPPQPSNASFLNLAPGIRLRIENAYWEPGAVKRGLAGYLGTEIATYGVAPNGSLRFVVGESKMTVQRPKDQEAAKDLLPSSHLRSRFYRLYYAVKFSKSTGPGAPVLLGARSPAELEQMGSRLKEAPDEVCRAGSVRCTVFPESCTVSAEMVVVVNGQPTPFLYGSTLAAVAKGHTSVMLERGGIALNSERLMQVPLMPNDVVRF